MPLSVEADFSRIQLGDTASCEMTVTEEQVDAFARLSLDDNPLHMDDSAAHEYGFPRRVAHGMLALSAISRLIGTALPGPGALWLSQDVQFATPVFVGDTLEATVTVQQLSAGARVVVLATEARNLSTGGMVLRGTAKVRVPPRKPEGQL